MGSSWAAAHRLVGACPPSARLRRILRTLYEVGSWWAPGAHRARLRRILRTLYRGGLPVTDKSHRQQRNHHDQETKR
jgi:hypothetical protein